MGFILNLENGKLNNGYIITISSILLIFFSCFNPILTEKRFLYVISEVQAQNTNELEIKEDKNECISYNKSEKLISITCKYAGFANVTGEIIDPNILILETKIDTINSIPKNKK